jgi:hypothetical protein
VIRGPNSVSQSRYIFTRGNPGGYSLCDGQIFTNSWWASIVNYQWNALRFMRVLGTNTYAIPSSPEVYPYRLQWEGDRSLPTAGPLYNRNHQGISRHTVGVRDPGMEWCR